MSATDSRVATAPVKTQWDPTTASASPASSSHTTTTAWVRILYCCALQQVDSCRSKSGKHIRVYFKLCLWTLSVKHRKLYRRQLFSATLHARKNMNLYKSWSSQCLPCRHRWVQRSPGPSVQERTVYQWARFLPVPLPWGLWEHSRWEELCW